MDFLSREGSPISEELWAKIDEAVVSTAKKILTGRRFISLYGPMGAGVQVINVDDVAALGETPGDIAVIHGRKYQPLALLCQDFALLWRDLEYAEQMGLPVDLSPVRHAATKMALKEDELIFQGREELGYKGLLTEEGVGRLPLSDWSAGENPFRDVAAGIARFTERGIVGRLALAVSPELYVHLQRIQPGTGTTEFERVSRLVDGNIFKTPVLKANQAVLVCAEPQNLDLVVGQDIKTAYLETKDLNHFFRIVETVLLRIKNKDAVIVYA